MIPQLDGNGLLPPGVWDCTLEEIQERFCWNDHRRELWQGLERFLDHEYRKLPIQFPLWIDGSFCRKKEIPSDIDVVLDVSSFDASIALPVVIPVHLRHDEIKAKYHIDAWPRHPNIPRDLASFFQYVGDKAAAELRLQPTDPKGILRVNL